MLKERRKKINVEFDEEGFIVTQINKKKSIEFMGFDKVWRRINNLHKVLEFSLSVRSVRDFGQVGTLS
jgi:tubulin-specific chaperone E